MVLIWLWTTGCGAPAPPQSGWTQEATTLAQRQDGVILDGQILGLGVSRRTLQRRVREGAWVRARRGLLATPGTRLSRMTRSRAFILLYPELVITGPAAGDFLGQGPRQWAAPGRSPWVVRESGKQSRIVGVSAIRHPGLVPRKPDDRLAREACLVAATIRFTTPNRARQVALAAVQQRVVTVRDLLAEVHKLRPVPGYGQLMRVIGQLDSGAHAEPAFRFHELLRDHGFSGWRANSPVRRPDGRTAPVDFVVPHSRVAMEIDGLAYHSDRNSFEQDRVRGHDLVSPAGKCGASSGSNESVTLSTWSPG